jgi:hypothetical protein
MDNYSIHEVTLNYIEDANGNPKLTQPAAIRVSNGHKIRFKRGSVPPDYKVIILFTEPNHFSSALFDEGQADVSVVCDLSHSTFYQCGLRAQDGHIIPSSLSDPFAGGQIDPATGSTGN